MPFIMKPAIQITAVKGEGLMIGIDTKFQIKELLHELLEAGLMATQAGKKTHSV